MRAFRFPLQAVLTLREQTEQTAQLRCAQAATAVESALARHRGAEAAFITAQEMLGAQLARGGAANQLDHLRLYSERLREHADALAAELTQARRLAEHARYQLTVATQQRESLERVRGQKRRRHDYRVAQAEQKVLDELAGRGPSLMQARRQRSSEL